MRAELVVMLLVLAPLVALHGATDTGRVINSQVASCPVPLQGNVTKNVTNVTLIPVPMVNITLSNGSVLSFQSIDNATLVLLKLLLGGEIRPQDILRVDVVPIREWASLEKYVVNVTANETLAKLNVTFEAGYRLFFLRLRNATAWKCNGTIAASTWLDWWTETLGTRLHRMIYGRAPVLKGVDVFGRNVSVKLTGRSVLVVLNASSSELVSEVSSLLSAVREMLDCVVVVDTSNNRTAALQVAQSLVPGGNVTVFLSANVTVVDEVRNETYNSTCEAFGFVGGYVTIQPLMVVAYEGIVVWKWVGVPAVARVRALLRSLSERGLVGLAEYSLINVTVVARENEETTIWIVLGEGFGDVGVRVSYAFLDAENQTIESKDVEASRCSRLGENVFAVYGVFVPNGTRYMRVNITVTSKLLGVSRTWSYTIKVIYEVRRKRERFPYEVIVGLVALILILAFLAWDYRRLRR